MKKIIIFSLGLCLFSVSTFCQISYLNGGIFPTDMTEKVEYVGRIHNEYLVSIENSLNNHVLIPQNDNFLSQLDILSERYFTSIGINSEFDVNRPDMTSRNALTFDDVTTTLSVDAKRMINELQNKLNQNPSTNDFEIFCNNKIKEATTVLTNDQEKFIVGIAFSIGKNSYFYWNDHSANWLSYFPYNTNVTNKLPSWAASDIIGGISGAIHGFVGGPAGSIAMGIMEGGFASAGHLIGHGFHWWD